MHPSLRCLWTIGFGWAWLAVPVAWGGPPPTTGDPTALRKGIVGYSSFETDLELEKIAQLYPELATRAWKDRTSYMDSPLYEGERVLRLAQKLTDSEALFRRLEEAEEAKGKINSQRPAATLINAKSYLDEIEASLNHTCRGYSPSETALLANAPVYVETPLLEFSQNWKVHFQRGVGSERTGESFTIDLPASWIQNNPPPKAPGRSFTVAFTGGAGLGEVTLFLGVKPTGPTTHGDRLPLFDLAAAQHRHLPGEPEAAPVSLKLGGVSASQLTYELPTPDGGHTRTIYDYSLEGNPPQIDLAFILSQPRGSNVTLDQLQKKYTPLIDAIVSSLKLEAAKADGK